MSRIRDESSSDKYPQPQRGCGPSIPARAPDLSHNAVGVDSISGRAPKVGVARQPWAGGPNPFGIVRSAGLRPLRPAALRMVRGCCGSETRAPVEDAPSVALLLPFDLPSCDKLFEFQHHSPMTN